MAEPTVDGFRADFGEFSETDDGLVALALRQARAFYDRDHDGTYLATAHLLTLEARESKSDVGGSGEVTMEQFGRKMASYKPMAESGDETFWSRTTYGRLYLVWVKSAPVIGALVV